MAEVLPHDGGINMFASYYLIDYGLFTQFMENPNS